jgi:hypothetical protein
VHLVGFIIRTFVVMHGHMDVILEFEARVFSYKVSRMFVFRELCVVCFKWPFQMWI